MHEDRLVGWMPAQSLFANIYRIGNITGYRQSAGKIVGAFQIVEVERDSLFQGYDGFLELRDTE